MPGTKYSTEMKAVRLVRKHTGDYLSEWVAIGEVARRLSIGSAEMPRKWSRRADVDGKAPGRTTAESAEIREPWPGRRLRCPARREHAATGRLEKAYPSRGRHLDCHLTIQMTDQDIAI